MSHAVVSIVIPVYDAEATLEPCLNSVLSQDFQELQIILVNDGSTDESLSICKRFEASDKRILVIDQPNGGPSKARNSALAAAGGEYIQFVDSDDRLLEGATSALVKGMERCDMTIARFLIGRGGKELERGLLSAECTLDRPQLLHVLSRKPGSYFFSALWNKMYRREIFTRHGIAFDESLSWGEDSLFNLRCYRHVQHVHFLKRPVYLYKKTTSGQTWRTAFQVRAHVRTKRRIHHALKELYIGEDLHHRYRYRLMLYPFSITLSK